MYGLMGVLSISERCGIWEINLAAERLDQMGGKGFQEVGSVGKQMGREAVWALAAGPGTEDMTSATVPVHLWPNIRRNSKYDHKNTPLSKIHCRIYTVTKKFNVFFH